MTKETVDEAISRIKFMICDGCNSYGGVRCRACELGDGMSVIECMENPNERVVTWHPFPNEKPTDDAEYLITRYKWVRHGICENLESTVEKAFFYSINGVFEGFDDADVIAWSELPRPYEEKEDEVHI